MKIELLKGIKTLEELKGAYRKLAFKLHPDRIGGNKEKFQQLVNEYEYLSKTLKNSYGYTESTQACEDFINIIEELMKYFEDKEYITIELKGTWFWVWGTTKEDEETKSFLKKLKFRWNKVRECWQHGEGRPKGKAKDIEEINNKYGNKVIKEGKKKPFKPCLN